MILLEAAVRADVRSAGAFPPQSQRSEPVASAQLPGSCAWVFYQCLYTSLGAKIAVPVVLAVLAPPPASSTPTPARRWMPHVQR